MRRPTLIVAALILLFVAAFIAGTVPFDLQVAVDSCPSGGTVAIPAGTYVFTLPVKLKSGITVRGAGMDRTILTMPVQDEPTALLEGNGISGVTISDLAITSPSPRGYVFAMWIYGYSNVNIERVKVTGCHYALKADTSGSNLVVRDFTARDCGQVYVSNLTGGLFERLDLQMVTEKISDTTFHALYVGLNNHHLRFNDIRARGGSGWTIQLWTDSGWTSPSADIVFDGLDTAGYPMVIGDGFQDVTLKNLRASSLFSGPCVMLQSPRSITIDGLTASGGSAFLDTYDSGHPENVILRNGTYAGTTLVQANADITGLVIENVGLTP